MTTFLTQVNGFTPVIDAVVADAGLNEALVYGMTWRYCRMSDGICRASTTTIGNRLALSRRTVQRCMARLVSLGYLHDKTPGLKNRPHIYADTGLVRIRGLMEVSDSPALGSRGDSTAPESHTTASESRSEPPSLRHSGAVAASESHMSRVFKREEEKRQELRDAGFPKSSQLPLDKIEWEMVKNELALCTSKATYTTCIEYTEGHRDGDVMIVETNALTRYEWLTIRLRPTIAQAVKDICGPKVTVRYVLNGKDPTE